MNSKKTLQKIDRKDLAVVVGGAPTCNVNPLQPYNGGDSANSGKR
jgi:hypothetical protein